MENNVSSGKKCVIVFVKNLASEEVKSRLAKSIGEVAAKNIYLDLMANLRKELRNPGYDKQIYYSRHIENQDLWGGEDFYKFVQIGVELGERMENAFMEAFHSSYSKVLLVGSDIPYLTEGIILNAFKKLEKFDVVIGPAFDGGYYLIGLNYSIPELFRSIPWGTNRVLQETQKILIDQSKTWFWLPELHDIDTVEDLDFLKTKDRKRYRQIIEKSQRE